MDNKMKNQPQQGKIRCEQCNKDFNNQQELQDHNRQQHNR